ncbi:Endosomal targeting BRO1-like domain-containing protein [Forsythia ovata]|uniref:Endosomal targeting BRO1-like domain-containing protein n=1 Tax=Forsythia ovata TaxID=205694 RepID=A0ABD1WDN4_9LAMI
MEKQLPLRENVEFLEWEILVVFRNLCLGVVYENALLARDSGTLEQLKELSSKRKAVEESINENSFITEAIAREMSGGLTSGCEQDIQKLENYLPLLENLVHHVDLISNNHRMTCWISDLKIRWSSTLTSSSIFHLHGPKFYQINDLHFELGMILVLYGAMLRERALEVLSKDLVQSATLFRKASGVYHYLAHEVLPPLQNALPPERPPEATSRVFCNEPYFLGRCPGLFIPPLNFTMPPVLILTNANEIAELLD